MEPQSTSQQPVQQMPTPGPLPTPEGHSHKGMYVAVGLSLAAVAALLLVVLTMIPKNQTTQTTTALPLNQQPLSPTQNEVQQATPMPITNSQNLDSATQTLDSTDVTPINAGIDQNSKDTSTFGQ